MTDETRTEMKLRAEKQYAHILGQGHARQAAIFRHATEQLIDFDNPAFFQAIGMCRRTPVTIDEFIQSREFMGDLMEIWPALMPDLRKMNPDVLIGEAPCHEALLAGATGCHAAGTPILMYDGTLRDVERVKVGDQLMGPDSQPRTVLSLAWGREDMYRITPIRGGEPFIVNHKHILSLKRTRRYARDGLAGQIINITVEDYLVSTQTFKDTHKLWRVGVDFAPSCNRLAIPPYIFGLCLRDTGVLERKRIPHAYLTASREDRLALLAGLIDTDGRWSCGGYEITQLWKAMADGIVYLARSLGFLVNVAERCVKGVSYHRMFISGDTHLIPVRLARKRVTSSHYTRNPLVSGFSVENIGMGDYFGFALSGDHLYLDGGFTVAHNTGKTHLSYATNSYQVYLMTCYENPQLLFGLMPNTPLVFQFQSVNPTITKRVIYQPFRQNFLAMPYTQKWVPHDKITESELRLEQNIMIVPASASLQSLVGQAIPGGMLDEVNFMQIIKESKQVAGAAGLGGHYDQAELVYRNMSRRRKRSFITKGVSIGCICVLSSTRYAGDFLDRRIAEVTTLSETNIFTSRHKQYEVTPQERYQTETFRVLIGTETYGTRVLKDEEVAGLHYPTSAHIENVPVDFKADFLRDPEGAQRDVIGIASNAITPFFARREKIVDAVMAGHEFGLLPWVEKQDVDLMLDGMPQIIEANLPKNRSARRYVHVDLSTSVDSCGIGIVRVAGQEAITREDGMVEMLPVYVVEAAISIKPSQTHHLDPSEVRQWIMRLVKFHGINIAMVSYDGFQSAESMNLLRKAGIPARYLSVDRTTEPYMVMRRAMYDDRIKLVDSPRLRQELSQLEYLAIKDKVDHPPKGGKDVSDGVAGAIFSASRNRKLVGAGVVDDDGRTVRTLGSRLRPLGNTRPAGRPRPTGGDRT